MGVQFPQIHIDQRRKRHIFALHLIQQGDKALAQVESGGLRRDIRALGQ